MASSFGRVSALCKDLFFTVKIDGLLRPLGCPVAFLDPSGDVRAQLAAEPPAVLIVDLTCAPEAFEAAVAWARDRAAVIAFGSHVDSERLNWAREAGCAAVMSKGAVDKALPFEVAKQLARAGGGSGSE
jgi:hypothetical protein